MSLTEDPTQRDPSEGFLNNVCLPPAAHEWLYAVQENEADAGGPRWGWENKVSGRFIGGDTWPKKQMIM